MQWTALRHVSQLDSNHAICSPRANVPQYMRRCQHMKQHSYRVRQTVRCIALTPFRRETHMGTGSRAVHFCRFTGSKGCAATACLLFLTTPHRTTLHGTAPHYTTLHRTAPHSTALHRTVPHHTAPHHTTLYSMLQPPAHTAATMGSMVKLSKFFFEKFVLLSFKPQCLFYGKKLPKK